MKDCRVILRPIHEKPQPGLTDGVKDDVSLERDWFHFRDRGLAIADEAKVEQMKTGPGWEEPKLLTTPLLGKMTLASFQFTALFSLP